MLRFFIYFLFYNLLLIYLNICFLPWWPLFLFLLFTWTWLKLLTATEGPLLLFAWGPQNAKCATALVFYFLLSFSKSDINSVCVHKKSKHFFWLFNIIITFTTKTSPLVGPTIRATPPKKKYVIKIINLQENRINLRFKVVIKKYSNVPLKYYSNLENCLWIS